jgi:anti-anti-sigma regulatory factor
MLGVELRGDHRTAVIECRGRMLQPGARLLDEAVDELLGRSLVSLVVDCSRVDQIDAAGMAGLLRVVAVCYDAGLPLHLVGSAATGDISELTGIADHSDPD